MQHLFSYTRFSLLYLLTYIITQNNFIGAVSFNTTIAVILSFESSHIIDSNIIPIIINECNGLPLCRYSPRFFYIYDFIIHVVPLYTYLIFPNLFNLSIPLRIWSSLVSASVHILWGYIISNGSMQLESIYIPSSKYKLSCLSWKKLWGITIIGHFSFPLCSLLYFYN